MDILHLKCLLTVLSCGSFTEAGEILHLSQSSISKKVISLEDELGLKLIERSGKKIVLTPSGQRLMEHFVNILESYDRAMQTLDDILNENNTGRKNLRILGVPPISRYNIISVIDSFAKKYPDIHVSIEEMETDRLLLMLQYGNCDLAFCGDIGIDHKHYNTQFVQSESFMVAMSNKNPLSKKPSVRLIDLKDEKFILNRPESLLYLFCVDACIRAGFQPNVVLLTARPTIAFEYLHSNREYIYMGLRKTLIDSPSELHRVLPIEDSPSFDFCYVWRKTSGLSEAASTYLRYAKEAQLIQSK
jgi:DNA-binding transcriptional LysR family regulator